MKLAQILVATALTTVPVWGSITVNFAAGDLRTAFGSFLAPADSLVVIGASTGINTFAAPTPTSFFNGDDYLIAKGTVSSTQPGWFEFAYNDTLSAGQPLQIYWYPTLTLSATEPGSGTPYGTFRTDAIIDGSDFAWVVPADNAIGGISFLTASQSGSNPNSAGWANLAVVPEPGAYMCVFGALSLFGGMYIRRLKKS